MLHLRAKLAFLLCHTQVYPSGGTLFASAGIVSVMIKCWHRLRSGVGMSASKTEML